MTSETVAAPAEARPAGHQFEPVLIGFTCNWCSYRAADLAGTARTKYPPNIRLIRLMCSGRLDPTFVLKAFAEGADGVLVSGCHPGECHYIEQNYKALRRFQLLRRTIAGLGIEPERLQLAWASAAEGTQLALKIVNFTEEMRELGPLNWPAPAQFDGVSLDHAWEATGGDPSGPPELPGGTSPEHAVAAGLNIEAAGSASGAAE